MKKKILITGGRGFIGRNLKEQLASDHEVIAPCSNELDLLDSDKVKDFLKANGFSTIIHCATHDASRNSKKDQDLVLSNNLQMFFNLTRCKELYGRMFYFGSGAEYDSEFYIPKMKEDYFDTHVPKNQYGFSKYIMAQYVSCAENIIDLRIFGCFGKYEDWAIRFISNAICRAVYNFDITIRQNVYFDYLYIDDLVRIMRWFIKQDELCYKHYNVCTGKSMDLLTLARKVIEVSDKDLGIKIGIPALNPEYSGDNSRLMSEMGDFDFTPVSQSIKELYNWYLEHKSDIDKSVLLVGNDL